MKANTAAAEQELNDATSQMHELKKKFDEMTISKEQQESQIQTLQTNLTEKEKSGLGWKQKNIEYENAMKKLSEEKENELEELKVLHQEEMESFKLQNEATVAASERKINDTTSQMQK